MDLEPMDTLGGATGGANSNTGRLSGSGGGGGDGDGGGSSSSSSQMCRDSGRRRRPVPDAPRHPPEKAASRRRRAEVGEERTQQRVDDDEEAHVGVASPAITHAQRGMYGTVTSVVECAVGFPTPGLRHGGDTAPSTSSSPIAAAIGKPSDNDEAGKNRSGDKDEEDQSNWQQDTEATSNPASSGLNRYEDERPALHGALRSPCRGPVSATDKSTFRLGMSASISAPLSAQPAPRTAESLEVFPDIRVQSATHLRRASSVPCGEAEAGDGLGFASLRKHTTGHEVDAPDSTPPFPRRDALLGTSTTPERNPHRKAAGRIDFGSGSERSFSGIGDGSGNYEDTHETKTLFTPEKVQGLVQAMRLRRGLPTMAAMHLLSKTESKSAAKLRLEILRILDDGPIDRQEDSSAGERAPSQATVAKGGKDPGSQHRADDSKAKTVMPLVVPVGHRPALQQSRADSMPSVSIESTLLPPPPPLSSLRSRSTVGPAAAVAWATVGERQRLSISGRSGVVGIGAVVRKPPGCFDDGVDLLTPSRRAEIEEERAIRAKIEKERTTRESSSSQRCRDSGRRRRPVPDAPRHPPEKAASRRRRAEVGEERTQQRVDDDEEARVGVASPVFTHAQRGMYGTVTSVVGCAVGFPTPGLRRGRDAAPSTSSSPIAAAIGKPSDNDEAGKNRSGDKDEEDQSNWQQDTEATSNPASSGLNRYEDERPALHGALRSPCRGPVSATDKSTFRLGMSASISAPLSAQPAPRTAESLEVFPDIRVQSATHLRRASSVPCGEAEAGDGLGFASLRKHTTGHEVDAPDSTPPFPRRDALLGTSTTPERNPHRKAAGRIDFGSGSERSFSGIGDGSGNYEDTHETKTLFTPEKVQGLVQAMRLRRGLPTMAAMHLLSKTESKSAAKLRLEILRILDDGPIDRQEDSSAGERAPSQATVAKGGKDPGSQHRADDSKAKTVMPLVVPVGHRPALQQSRADSMPSVSIESTLLPPPPPLSSLRSRSTVGPAAAVAWATVGERQRLSISGRSGVVGIGAVVRKPPGCFDDGVDLLTPSRRAEIEEERAIRAKIEKERTTRERSFGHGMPGGTREWEPPMSSSAGGNPSCPSRSRQGSNLYRRMCVAEESPRRNWLRGADTPKCKEQGIPLEMTHEIFTPTKNVESRRSSCAPGPIIACDARDATPSAHTRRQEEDSPLPTRTLSVPDPMMITKASAGGGQARGGYHNLASPTTPSRSVHRSKTLPERPGVVGGKQTPHDAPVKSETGEEGGCAAGAAAAVPDHSYGQKNKRSIWLALAADSDWTDSDEPDGAARPLAKRTHSTRD